MTATETEYLTLPLYTSGTLLKDERGGLLLLFHFNMYWIFYSVHMYIHAPEVVATSPLDHSLHSHSGDSPFGIYIVPTASYCTTVMSVVFFKAFTSCFVWLANKQLKSYTHTHEVCYAGIHVRV